MLNNIGGGPLSGKFGTLHKDDIDEHGNAFDCLDHSYFLDEITKLIQLRNEIELDRFHRRISNKDPKK
jgi:hypothetical protein